jgi:hypothetical protein
MKKCFCIIVLFTSILFVGWGAVGHRIINKKSGLSFPSSMSVFSWFPDSMAVHGPDADYRKGSDPTEEYRHYIDIEYYTEFVNTGRIPQSLDSLIALYGQTFVTEHGIVPFAIIAYTDSVKKYFQLHNYQTAMLRAADLGHYVADGHQPLHVTRYYNGWSTLSSGIHSRYETQMVNRDTAYIQYSGDSVVYINDINNFAFNIIYSSNKYVDSVYRADSIAQAISGSNGSTLYYQNFWNQAGSFTIQQFKNASYKLACLVYTAWVNAGSPIFVSNNGSIAESYNLYQNYPNPFNPVTNIKYRIANNSFVLLRVYDILGKEITTLVNEKQLAGTYVVPFSVNQNSNYQLSSGIYFYTLNVGDINETKKMILTK